MDIPVYLINLDTDKDRLEFMDKQLKDLNIRYERFPAIRGAQLPDCMMPFFFDDFGNTRLSDGEIGCYASHLELIKRVSLSREPALIMEDDVRLNPEFPVIIKEVMQAGLAFDILRLSASTVHKKRMSFTKGVFSGGRKAVKYLRVPMGTGAYIVTPRGSQKFLEWKLLRSSPIDHDLQRVWQHDLRTLGVSPELVSHNVLGSSSIGMIDERERRLKRSRITKAAEGVQRLIHACLT